MGDGEERLIRLAGTRNLRDVGGYPTRDGGRVRWRTLYRSDCLDRIDASGQDQLVRRGVRTIIDLRDDLEVAERPNALAASRHVAYRRVPMWDDAPPEAVLPDFSRGYRGAARAGGAAGAGALRLRQRPRGLDWSLWAAVAETPPERMRRTLDYVDERYDGVVGYLRLHNVDTATLDRLRELLIER